MTTAHFSRLPGGRYEARQIDDGTWDVLDVPVFSVIGKGVKGAPRDLTETDLRSAVSIHGRKFSEDKFLARTNVLHNFGPHRPTPAGFFLPKRVGSLRMGGKERPVIYASLIGVPDETFRALDSDRLPYCSVEVRTWDPLQFGALALLDTEPPFFEFPLLTIGTKTAQPEITRIDAEPALAMAGDGAAFLFRFSEDPMPEDVLEEEKDEEEDVQMTEGDGDLGGALATIEAKLAEMEPLLALLPKLQALISSGGEPAEEEEKEGPVELSAEPTAQFEQTRMTARMTALEDRCNQADRETEISAMFDAAVASLERESYHLSDTAKTRFRSAAEQGEQTLALFTETYRENARKDPPPTLDGMPADTRFPAEVMKFSDDGPDAFTAAKQSYREWMELRDSKAFGATVSPLDQYLNRNVGG